MNQTSGKYMWKGWRKQVLLVAICAACAFQMSAPAQAQNDQMIPIPTPAQPGAIELGTGSLPNATAPESWYMQYGSRFTRNVTVATLTPYLPDKANATGAAAIVAPGGGFRTLSMENEGSQVAEALAKRGVAAFVLKYRLVPTPDNMPGFAQSLREMFAAAARPPQSGQKDPATTLAPQLADARAAFSLVRQHATEWGVDPNKIGMVGFSAGAMLTLTTELSGGDAKPAFIGIIYGPLAAVKVPADAPPMFVALAADDPIFGGGGFGLINSWRTAKKPVEFHLFEQGGHGFGMYQKPTTSTGWFGEFARWLAMHGWANRQL